MTIGLGTLLGSLTSLGSDAGTSSWSAIGTFVAGFAIPLWLGTLVATVREIRLPAEPPLAGWRKARRITRIVIGFGAPLAILAAIVLELMAEH